MTSKDGPHSVLSDQGTEIFVLKSSGSRNNNFAEVFSALIQISEFSLFLQIVETQFWFEVVSSEHTFPWVFWALSERVFCCHFGF